MSSTWWKHSYTYRRMLCLCWGKWSHSGKYKPSSPSPCPRLQNQLMIILPFFHFSNAWSLTVELLLTEKMDEPEKKEMGGGAWLDKEELCSSLPDSALTERNWVSRGPWMFTVDLESNDQGLNVTVSLTSFVTLPSSLPVDLSVRLCKRRMAILSKTQSCWCFNEISVWKG